MRAAFRALVVAVLSSLAVEAPATGVLLAPQISELIQKVVSGRARVSAKATPLSSGSTIRPKPITVRIAVASLTSARKPPTYVARSVLNHAMYATRHSYVFSLFSHIDENRPPAWSKVLALKRLVSSGNLDWILWLDTDTIVTNFNTRIESLLPGDPQIDIIASRDCNGINLGVFLVRASESSLALLEEVYHGQHVNKESIEHRWWENLSFVNLYDASEEVRNRTLLIQQKEINGYAPGAGCGDDWSEGDFIIHFAGMDEEARERLVDEFLGKVFLS